MKKVSTTKSRHRPQPVSFTSALIQRGGSCPSLPLVELIQQVSTNSIAIMAQRTKQGPCRIFQYRRRRAIKDLTVRGKPKRCRVAPHRPAPELGGGGEEFNQQKHRSTSCVARKWPSAPCVAAALPPSVTWGPLLFSIDASPRSDSVFCEYCVLTQVFIVVALPKTRARSHDREPS
jgi:hypothetical protein